MVVEALNKARDMAPVQLVEAARPAGESLDRSEIAEPAAIGLGEARDLVRAITGKARPVIEQARWCQRRRPGSAVALRPAFKWDHGQGAATPGAVPVPVLASIVPVPITGPVPAPHGVRPK